MIVYGKHLKIKGNGEKWYQGYSKQYHTHT